MKDRIMADAAPVFIIAETGTSHNGSLERAERLIEAAAFAGADCVKTQIVFADEIIHPNTGEVELPGGSIRLYDRFRDIEQDFDFYLRMKELTESAGLEFLASPFGAKSLEWLLELGCSAIKIASPELNHFPLLKLAAESGKQLYLSTGVSKLADIEAALAVTGKENVALMHCITSYPAPEDEYNLRVIPTLSARFGIPAGVSDHSTDPVIVPAAATAMGACCIEKHITISNEDGGLDDPIALRPEQFREMAEAVRRTEDLIYESGATAALQNLEEQYGNERIKRVLGSGRKDLAASEEPNYGRTNRSVHALFELPAGTILSYENTALLRTEKKLRPGIRPEFYDNIIGKKLIATVKSGEGITEEDLGQA